MAEEMDLHVDISLVPECKDENGHHFAVVDVESSRFLYGNARCLRVTRFLIYCTLCSAHIFASDPEQPELKKDEK